MLARLRDLFGDPLFVRVQRGILPTPRAQSLAAPLKQLLADSRRLIAIEAFDPVTAEMTFAISANDYMQHALLVPFIEELRRDAPKLRLTIKPPTAVGLADALAQGSLDLALTIPQFAMSDLPSRLLYREHYVAGIQQGTRSHVAAVCRSITIASTTTSSFHLPVDRLRARPTKCWPISDDGAACVIPSPASCSYPSSFRPAT